MEEAISTGNRNWMRFANETYISEAGWYFKTLAVQEIGESWETVNTIKHADGVYVLVNKLWHFFLCLVV